MQTSAMIKVASQLRDPMMMDFAIMYYNGTPPDSPQTQWMHANWFTDAVLGHWIAQARGYPLADLFQCLPAELFASLAPMIAERWRGWPTLIACGAAIVLAKIAPELAAQAFLRYADEQPIAEYDLKLIYCIVSNLHLLPPSPAQVLLDRLSPHVLAINKEDAIAFVSRHAFKTIATLRPELLPQFFDQMFWSSDFDPIDLICDAARSLFGHDGYVQYYFYRAYDDRPVRFSDLAAFFDPGAPLAEMDALVESGTPAGLLTELLETYREKSPACLQVVNIAIYLAATYGTDSEDAADTSEFAINAFMQGDHIVSLAAIALAALAELFERSQLSLDGLDSGSIVGLLAADLHPKLHFNQLFESLGKFPRAQVVKQIMRALPGVWDTPRPGALALIKAIALLGWKEFIPTLIACDPSVQTEDVAKAACAALIMIGDPARDALIAQWGGLDTRKKLLALVIMLHTGGKPVADFAVQHFAEVLRLDGNLWVQLMTAEPDARLVELVRRELRRKQEHIDVAYCRLCSLLDIDNPELAETRARIAADHAMIAKSHAQADADGEADAEPDTALMRLPLRCVVCGDINLYNIKGVVIGDFADDESILVADEFPCISCGGWTEFKIEESAQMAIFEDYKTLRALHNANSKNFIKSFFHMGQFRTRDGIMISFPRAIGELEARIADHPQDWLSWLSLSGILQQINRPRHALRCMRMAYSLNASVLVAAPLAAWLERMEQNEEAFDILQRAIGERWKWHATIDPGARAIAAAQQVADSYHRLRFALGRVDLPELPPNWAMHIEKPGRNDFCPCGSGKKFKKCCGN